MGTRPVTHVERQILVGFDQALLQEPGHRLLDGLERRISRLIAE